MQHSDRVYITGYGIVSAFGIGKEKNAKALFSNKSFISTATMKYCDGDVSSAFGVIKEPLRLDRDKFISHELDRVMELAILSADEAIKQAGILDVEHDPLRIGIVVGTSLGGLLSGDQFHSDWLLRGIDNTRSEVLKQYPLHAVADIVARRYGINGPKVIVSTACSSGANALGLAYSLICDNQCDIVLTGGVDPLSRFSFAGFTALGAIKQDICQPYSDSRGINIGEGSAFFVLESGGFALNRKAAKICEILGYGLSEDAYHPTAPDINGNGAIRSMNNAISNANIDLQDISYINGHGTGTPANDAAECKAWKGFVKEHAGIPMISNKGAVGHCMGAAGAVELVFSIMSIEKGMIPPTLNFKEKQDKDINFVPNESIKYDVKTVLSNSFAFGGNNCSVVLSKDLYKKVPASPDSDTVVITGLGCVGVGGDNINDYYQNLADGKCLIGKIDTDDEDFSTPFVGLASQNNTYFKKYIQSGKLRRIDRITKFAMASGRQALLDSKLVVTPKNAARIGVIYGTGTGPATTIRTFNEQIIKTGISGVSPDLFPNTVLNAAPGQFSIANNLKGVSSTISSGNTSGLNAFIYACILLKSNQADAIVVVSADEWDESLQIGNERLGLLSRHGNLPFSAGADGSILSEGSVAFVLERKRFAEQRNAKIIATVEGYFSVSNNPRLTEFDFTGTQWIDGFKRVLQNGKIPTIDFYASTSYGNIDLDAQEIMVANELFPNAEFYSIPRMIGTPFGTVGSYGILTDIYCLSSNKVPNPGNLENVAKKYRIKLMNGPTKKKYRYAATSVASFGGAYAGVVLSKLV